MRSVRLQNYVQLVEGGSNTSALCNGRIYDPDERFNYRYLRFLFSISSGDSMSKPTVKLEKTFLGTLKSELKDLCKADRWGGE